MTVAWGTRDVLLTYATQSRRARKLAALGPPRDAAPGCGHVPFFDDPELCTEVILQTTGRLRALSARRARAPRHAPGVREPGAHRAGAGATRVAPARRAVGQRPGAAAVRARGAGRAGAAAVAASA